MESELRKERELKEYLQELKEIKDLYLLQEQESQSDQTEGIIFFLSLINAFTSGQDVRLVEIRVRPVKWKTAISTKMLSCKISYN